MRRRRWRPAGSGDVLGGHDLRTAWPREWRHSPRPLRRCGCTAPPPQDFGPGAAGGGSAGSAARRAAPTRRGVRTRAAWFPRVTAHSLVIVASLLTYVLTTRAERERRPPADRHRVGARHCSPCPIWRCPCTCCSAAANCRAQIAAVLDGGRPRPALGGGSHRELRPAAVGPRTRAHASERRRSAHRAASTVIAARTRRLDICTYILGNDAFGEEVTARLIACAQRGVRVRFLIDGVGAIRLPRAWFKRMRRGRRRDGGILPAAGAQDAGPRAICAITANG